MTITSVAGRCLHSAAAVHGRCTPLLWAVKQSSLRQLTTAQATVLDSRCTFCTTNAEWNAERHMNQSSSIRTPRRVRVQATEAEVTGQYALVHPGYSSAAVCMHRTLDLS